MLPSFMDRLLGSARVPVLLVSELPYLLPTGKSNEWKKLMMCGATGAEPGQQN